MMTLLLLLQEQWCQLLNQMLVSTTQLPLLHLTAVSHQHVR